jgi:hypothetical protein
MKDKGRHGKAAPEVLSRKDGPYGKWQRVELIGEAQDLPHALTKAAKSIYVDYPEGQHALVTLGNDGTYRAWVRRGSK